MRLFGSQRINFISLTRRVSDGEEAVLRLEFDSAAEAMAALEGTVRAMDQAFEGKPVLKRSHASFGWNPTDDQLAAIDKATDAYIAERASAAGGAE